ncbi:MULTISPECIES: DUF6912 family protein [Nocardia]|uniref:DUF6912 family protein n=1 Tax=Nocardia TaxID=1817 RepID=UPI001896156E|nr:MULTISPECIES: hypothetical protein [Nocardia]MBF6350839.1 hypothetical protein [Nocardia flavorosea]
MRVYVPATVSMLRDLVDKRELHAVGGTAFALTPALREAYASGDDEELSEVAMAEAARASLRLLADEVHSSSAPMYRRAVIAVDVTDATLRPDLDDAVVKLDGPIEYKRVGSVHMDLAEAESAVAEAVDIIDAADLGDEDAEFVLGDAEDHQLAWYATQELPFLLDLL